MSTSRLWPAREPCSGCGPISTRSAPAPIGESGNLTDLGRLVDIAAESGAAFVGISPLHSQRNLPPEVSPYCGTSRIFRNPIYLDVTAIPEISTNEARLAVRAPGTSHALQVLRGADHIDYAAVTALQRTVLEPLHRAFVQSRGKTPEYREYRARDEGLVIDFATFCALEEDFARRGEPRDWRQWPQAYRDPRSPTVSAFREQHAPQVDYHVFCQFELERQLAAAARRARDAGMPIGLYPGPRVG